MFYIYIYIIYTYMHNVYKHVHYIYPLGFNFHHPSTNHLSASCSSLRGSSSWTSMPCAPASLAARGRRWMGQRNPAPVEDAGKHPIIYRGSTILLVMQDFFHPQYHHLIWGMATNKIREAEFRANITSKHGKNLAKGGSWINKHFGIWV